MTTTRRGWRAALDSSLLLAVVVCGSASAPLAAAAVVAGRAPAAVASVGPAAALVAAGTHRAVVDFLADKGSPRSFVVAVAVAALAAAPAPSTGWSPRTSENAPRDSAEDDDDEALEHALTPVAARGVEDRELTHLDPDPAVSLESDGHSLRAPPQ